MAFYFGVTSDSVGTLFSSLGSSSSNSTTSLLSDYYSIKNGSYKKLLKSYYALQNEDSSSGSKKTTRNDALSSVVNGNAGTSTSKDSAKVLVNIEETATSLKESANKLLDKRTVNEVYSTDNLYNNIKEFVDNYNGVIDAAEDTNTSSIAKNLDSMINYTKANESVLSKIGITIGEDNKLSVDKDKLNSADVDTVKSLMNSTGSYAYRVSASASMINFNAEYEASRANTYTSSGTYSNSYNTGSLYDTLF